MAASFTGWLPVAVLVLVTMLVSSAVASGDDAVEHLEEAYDFQPNLIRKSAPHSTAPHSHRRKVSVASKTSANANPLTRFVSNVVSAHNAKAEAKRVNKVTAQLKKEEKRTAQKKKLQASALTAEKKKADTLKQQLTAMKRKSDKQASQLKKSKVAVAAAARTKEAGALFKSKISLEKAAKAVALPPAAPMARGQDAALDSVATSKSSTDSAPPLDGVSDDANIRQQMSASVAVDRNIQYDVAAAEKSVEIHEDKMLTDAAEEFELGQSQDASPRTVNAASRAVKDPKQQHAEVFLQDEEYEHAVALKEAKTYMAHADEDEVKADKALQPVDRLKQQEKARVDEAAAKAASEYVARTFKTKSKQASDSVVVLLQMPPAEAAITAQIAEMSTLSVELAKTIKEKSAQIAAAQRKLHPLSAKLVQLQKIQDKVHLDGQTVEGDASLMLSEEMGESAKPTHTVLLQLAQPKSELDDMANQEAALQKEVSSLGEEQDHLQAARLAKQAAARQAKHTLELQAQQVQKKAKEASSKQQKSQVYDAQLLSQEARLRMTTTREVEAESHLAAALQQKREDEHKAAPVVPVTQLNAEQQTREEYKRMYLQNYQEQAMQAKQDLKNHLRNVRDNDAQHLQQALLTIKDKKAQFVHDILQANELRESVEQDSELGESLKSNRATATLEQMRSTGANVANLEQDLVSQASVLETQMQQLEGYNTGVVDLADGLLMQVDASGADKSASSALISAAGSGSMKLRLQLQKLKALNSKAAGMASAVGSMRQLVESATTHNDAAQHKLTTVSGEFQQVDAHMQKEQSGLKFDQSFKGASEAELGEALKKDIPSFKPALIKSSEKDIGEADTVDRKSKTPIQAQMNWEKDLMVKAKSDVEQIKLDTPGLVAKQMQLDTKELSKVLNSAKEDLGAVAKQFRQTAHSISPSIQNSEDLDAEFRNEQDSADSYSRDMSSVQRGVHLADLDESKASHDIMGALSQIRAQAQGDA